MFQSGAAGICAAAGPGPDLRQRAIARRGVAGAHARRPWRRSTRSPGQTPGVAHTLTVAGYSFLQRPTARTSARCSSCSIRSTKRRSPPDLSRRGDHGPLAAAVGPEGQGRRRCYAFPAPPIPGLSVAGGFKLMVEDRGGLGLDALDRQTDALVAQAARSSRRWSASPRSSAPPPRNSTPDIDRTKVASLGIPLNDVNQTLQIYLGSLYVNNFNAFGRHWQVNVQAEGDFRNQVDDINLLAGPQQPGPDGPAGHAGRRARNRRPDLRQPLQPLHGRLDQRQPAAGRQHRRRDRRRSTSWPTRPCRCR